MIGMDRRGFLRASMMTGAGVMLASTAAACGQRGSNSGSSSGGSTASLTMQASWVNDAEFMGYYVADSEGYYTSEGIDFTYLPGGPSVVPESVLLANRADVALTSPDTTIQAIVNDSAPFVIVGTQYQKSPLGVVSLAKNGIKSPADLVGKTLAVPDSNRLTVSAMLKLNDIPESDVRIVPYAYDPTPLINGEVDASIDFVTNVPYTIREAGAEPVSFLVYDYGFQIPNDTVTITRDTLEKKRDAVVKWLRASRKGWETNFVDPKAYPTQFEKSWFKGSGRTIENEEYFNGIQKTLIETPQGIFTLSDETVGKCIDSLGQIGIKADASMFDTSLVAEI